MDTLIKSADVLAMPGSVAKIGSKATRKGGFRRSSFDKTKVLAVLQSAQEALDVAISMQVAIEALCHAGKECPTIDDWGVYEAISTCVCRQVTEACTAIDKVRDLQRALGGEQ